MALLLEACMGVEQESCTGEELPSQPHKKLKALICLKGGCVHVEKKSIDSRPDYLINRPIKLRPVMEALFFWRISTDFNV